MASIDTLEGRKKRYHRVVLVMGRNGSQDFFTRVLTTLVRIGLKNEEGMAPPNAIMKYMARMTQRSVNDKGLRTRVGRALQRGMENGLVTLKHGQFKLTRRAGVVADTKGKLWLKIPTLIRPGLPNKQGESTTITKKHPCKANPRDNLMHNNHAACNHRDLPSYDPVIRPMQLPSNSQPQQQQQHRQIQTNLYVSQSSTDRGRSNGCSMCRPSRPCRPSCRSPPRYRSPRRCKSRSTGTGTTKHNGHGHHSNSSNNNNNYHHK